MARTKPGETSVQVIMPIKAKERLQIHIKSRDDVASVSDLIRRLLQKYADENKLDADFDVGEWGGYRGDKG